MRLVPQQVGPDFGSGLCWVWRQLGGEFVRGGVVVLLAAEVAIVLHGGFEELVAAVVELAAVFTEGVHFGFGEGLEVGEDFRF